MSSHGYEDAAGGLPWNVLLCGGIAGVVTWASVFPLDVVKTRLQANTIEAHAETRPLLQAQSNRQGMTSLRLAREMYRTEGLKAFYRGLGVCSLRAFIVNAAQVCGYPTLFENWVLTLHKWATYEWLMKYLHNPTWNQPLGEMA
ncbi:mitochondrial carrier protein-domain-containing protein [Aspergillus venezuelensis]